MRLSFNVRTTANGISSCGTCHLSTYSCPGHVGHIELPVPVYHVTFMDQLLLLLRSKCEFCSHFKLHPNETHRFTCKLQLIQKGLVNEVKELDNIDFMTKKFAFRRTKTTSLNEETESEDSEEDEDVIRQRRDEFVERAMRRSQESRSNRAAATEKNDFVAEERRTVIREFLSAIRSTRSCGSCKGYFFFFSRLLTTSIDTFAEFRADTVKMGTIKSSESR